MALWCEPWFELIDVEQNTPEWLEARKGPTGVSIGSSAMGAASGECKYKKPFDLLFEIIFGSSFRGNAATRHGHECEGANANAWSYLNNNTPTFEVGVCRPTRHNPLFTENGYPYFGASIDRWACTSCDLKPEEKQEMQKHIRHEGFRVIECKCPFTEGTFRRDYDRKIKVDHLAQLHLQMAVLGIREIDYMVVLFDNVTKELLTGQLSRVYFSQQFWEWIYARALDVALTAVYCTFRGLEPEESMLEAFPKEAVPSVKIELLYA